MPDIEPNYQWDGYVPNAQRPRAYQPGDLLPGAEGAPLYQEWEDIRSVDLPLNLYLSMQY